MRSPPLSLVVALTALAALGCSGTGQPEIDYPALAVPAPLGAIAAGDWTVTLDRADVAFGPVYFCASSSSSATLCEAAVAELLEVTTFDARAAGEQPLGTVHGFTGAIRSASYDYGVHWSSTEGAPTAAPEAPGGHSARFEGSAAKGDVVLPFVADIDVLPQRQGHRAVPTTSVIGDVDDATRPRLEIHFDVGAWFADVDFDEALDQPGAGEGPYVIAAGSGDHTAIVQAMTSRRPPSFVWTADPPR